MGVKEKETKVEGQTHPVKQFKACPSEKNTQQRREKVREYRDSYEVSGYCCRRRININTEIANNEPFSPLSNQCRHDVGCKPGKQ